MGLEHGLRQEGFLGQVRHEALGKRGAIERIDEALHEVEVARLAGGDIEAGRAFAAEGLVDLVDRPDGLAEDVVRNRVSRADGGQQQEFVPAQPARHVPGPRHARNPAGRGGEKLVADTVAMVVVDVLKSVEVEQELAGLAADRKAQRLAADDGGRTIAWRPAGRAAEKSDRSAGVRIERPSGAAARISASEGSSSCVVCRAT